MLLDQFNRLIAFGFPSQQATLDAAYAASLALIPDGAAKTSGIAIGEAAAAAILALRENDGWDTQTVLDFNYPQGTAPGEYRFTPPFNFVFMPQWGTLPPFTLHNAAQFRPGAPYPTKSKRYTEDFNEVKSLGGDGITTPSARTPDQTEIALFWLESSPLQWNRIARTVSATAGLTCGRTRGSLDSSTSLSPTATLGASTPSTTTITGGQSRPFARQRRMATPTPVPTRRGRL